MDLMKTDKLYVNLFKGFDFTGVKCPFSPLETDVAVITVLRYRAACDTKLGRAVAMKWTASVSVCLDLSRRR